MEQLAVEQAVEAVAGVGQVDRDDAVLGLAHGAAPLPLHAGVLAPHHESAIVAAVFAVSGLVAIGGQIRITAWFTARYGRAQSLTIGVLVLAAVWACLGAWSDIVRQATHRSDAGYIMLVLPVACYLFWIRRSRARFVRCRPSAWKRQCWRMRQASVMSYVLVLFLKRAAEPPRSFARCRTR